MEAIIAVPIAVVLALAVAYLVILYLKHRWQISDILLTLIGGSILPAIFARAIRSPTESLTWQVSIFGLLIILGQMLVLPGTITGMQWCRRWKIESPLRRVAVIVYAWTIAPAMLMLLFAVLGLISEPSRNGNSVAYQPVIFGGGALVALIPAMILHRGPRETRQADENDDVSPRD